ncbi:MAG TPA: NADPH-dependent F420 reductase [Micropepsaceae bacterium]
MTTEKIAIIGGAGELGFGLALRWAKAGEDVTIGSRDAAKAAEAAARVGAAVPGARIAGLGNVQAAGLATIAVLAVPFAAQAGILKSIKPALKNAILVDTTVPLAASVGGRASRVLGVWEGSAAQQAAGLVPGVPVVSAFHNVSAEMLHDPNLTLDCDILISGDDASAKERLSALVRLIPGLRPLDAGPLEMSRVVESITALMISLNRRYKTHYGGIRITGLAI